MNQPGAQAIQPKKQEQQTKHATTTSVRRRAWEILTEGATDEGTSKRKDVIIALATLGTEAKAVSLVESALDDKDQTVLVAATEVRTADLGGEE